MRLNDTVDCLKLNKISDNKGGFKNSLMFIKNINCRIDESTKEFVMNKLKIEVTEPIFIYCLEDISILDTIIEFNNYYYIVKSKSKYRNKYQYLLSKEYIKNG